MKVILLPYAIADLNEIKDYIARENPAAAKKVAQRIKKSLQLLSKNPYLSTVKVEQDILEWHIPSLPYTLPYQIVNNEIQILRVFHESQNKPAKWENHSNKPFNT
ncbi:toxin ParE1/3/4 [Bathymodiolus japonicus methanotrophic gill symbiont]|uniref:type II toxin-antitoxin system RelE/ParE family toxin n=1 Tax=Bathymodiolus japonicus methanotrophic gill symbiont TaxID=113269 RepID=UPI001B4FEF07|nr:type II toxin-antitoxin system RelE/ParE family toxin [Bathymodiolus japonicus methanotrophic gill symbiont]GFO72673.1 toxin ParE1/3/4 [Bathymodiolus japonicus methanotrophic gill symbiont]